MSRQNTNGSWPQESIEGGKNSLLLLFLVAFLTDARRARLRDSFQQERCDQLPELQIRLDDQRLGSSLEEVASRRLVVLPLPHVQFPVCLS